MNYSIKEVPTGFQDAFELSRWPDWVRLRWKPAILGFRIIAPEDFDKLQRSTLSKAFDDKLPKLHRCNVQAARTVLVLEAIDIPFSHYQYIGKHLPELLEGRRDPPDEVYLVNPDKSGW